jgi:YVTN family beta-propeller protein
MVVADGTDTVRSPFSWILFIPLCAVIAAALSLLGACSGAPPENIVRPPAYQSTVSHGFTNFETEPVRPLVLSPDGRYLFALNTPDDYLEIFDAQGENLHHVGETAVGLRPVALALHGKEAWVVNHLSDSINVVDINDPTRPRVTHTLPVGDEPRGIVVAGPKRDRIFVATARRGESLNPGIGRAQVWIFDAAQPHATPKILTLFGTKPRALAASSDGRYLYVSTYLSGNRTATTSGEEAARLGRTPQLHSSDDVPYFGVPKQGAIARYSERGWYDSKNRDWTSSLPFQLPDYDVFVIDTAAESPEVIKRISDVGTVLFNMAVQPGTGALWVSNTEALNLVPHEPRLQGKFAHNRITQIYPLAEGGHRTQVSNLNPHIDHSVPTGPLSERKLSLAQPLDLVFHPSGDEAYVAAFGSGKIGVLNRTAQVVDRIDVGFGPGGLALDAQRQRLYVLNHLDGTVSVVDLRMRKAVATVPLRHNPVPTVVKQGRPFLYDAALTSGHGDLSCATCHVFADLDGVAWDLGNPDGQSRNYPEALQHDLPLEPRQALHPLKGPMVTQSLRGLVGTGPFHWRGDRFGRADSPGEDVESFKDFNPAYKDLLGRAEEISESAIEYFARFVFTIRYPPNPNQRLDRGMDEEQRAGFEFFTGPFESGGGRQNCVSCHKFPLGTNRKVNFESFQVGRDMKAAHLRNVYQKVGRFNAPGPQVAGFGLIHDGTLDTVQNFLRLNVFRFPGETEEEKDQTRRIVHSYIMAFDTGMAPAVGRQLTVSEDFSKEKRELIDLLMTRAEAGDCDLIGRAWEGSVLRGWLYRNMAFHGDKSHEAPVNLESLLSRSRRNGEPMTFTCVPPGDGVRNALDRDLDGHLNGDERLAGINLADAMSVPPLQSPSP